MIIWTPWVLGRAVHQNRIIEKCFCMAKDIKTVPKD